MPIPRVESLAELNALLEAADRSDDARHIAGRLATVGAMAESERPMLRALPAEPFDPTVPLRAKADRKARIAVRGSRYSVPRRMRAGRWEVPLGGGTVTALSARKGAEVLVLDAREVAVAVELPAEHVEGADQVASGAVDECRYATSTGRIACSPPSSCPSAPACRSKALSRGTPR